MIKLPSSYFIIQCASCFEVRRLKYDPKHNAKVCRPCAFAQTWSQKTGK